MAKNANRHKIKQDGVRTKSYCTCCQTANCSGYSTFNTPAERKRIKRAELGQYRGCGKEKDKCVCRS